MTRQNWTQGQAITVDDLNNIALGSEETIIGQVLRYLMEEQQGFAGDAFKATRVTGTTFTLGAGLGIYIDDLQTTPETKYRPLRNTNGATIYTITNPHATLSRRDIVQVRFKIETDASASRDVKDGVGTVLPDTVVIRKKWTFEIEIKDGTASGSPVAPSADTGWVKIAELLVSPSSTGIANQAAITDSRNVLKLLLEAHSDISALETRATNIETLNSSQASALVSLDGRLDTLEGQTLDTRLSAAETLNSSQATAITALQTKTNDVAAQTQDLWEWEAGRTNVTSIANSSNNLVFSSTLAISSYATAIPFASDLYGRYWELWNYLKDGLTLKIVDGGGHVWLIVPTAAGMATFQTHVTLGGVFTNATAVTMTLAAAGVGTLFTVFRNGASQANFSLFSTLSSFSASSTRWVAYGTSALVRANGAGLIAAIVPKKKWFRSLFAPNYSEITPASTLLNWDLQFEPGKAYRFSMAFLATSSGLNTDTEAQFFNHTSTQSSTTALTEQSMDFGTPGQASINSNFTFLAIATGFSLRFTQTISDEHGFHDFGGNASYLTQRNWPHLFIEEV